MFSDVYEDRCYEELDTVIQRVNSTIHKLHRNPEHVNKTCIQNLCSGQLYPSFVQPVSEHGQEI